MSAGYNSRLRKFNRPPRKKNPEATDGLPDDLAAILRNPNITIDRDHEIRLPDGRTLFEAVHDWRKAPSNTASAVPADPLITLRMRRFPRLHMLVGGRWRMLWRSLWL